mmetsp:Transcript_27266/g.40378  ORF Transcript_27266/g.40378 Transcript_27266/m.40378 type:complete len:122 (+) Transcript_27266:115-480(+)
MYTALLFLFSLSAQLNIVTAAGLRATARTTVKEKETVHIPSRHATPNQNTEVLRLTDDDEINFFKSEIEQGYLDRSWWEKSFLASKNKDDDDAPFLDDDQFRDPATGGFLPVEDQVKKEGL